MKQLSSKWLAPTATMLTLSGIVLALVGVGASHATTPEISPSEAASIAVHQVRLEEIAACAETCTLNALEVSVAHAAHFGEAQAVIARKPPSSANLTPDGDAMREWEQSPAYLIVIKSMHPLTLNVPHPPKEHVPSGVVSIAVDSQTGFVEARAIGPVGPNIAALASVVSSTVPQETVTASRQSGSAIIAATSHASGHRGGNLVGTLIVANEGAPGWAITATNSRHTYRTYARRHGYFSLHMQPGQYRLTVKRGPHRCQPSIRRVSIVAGVTRHIRLLCSGGQPNARR